LPIVAGFAFFSVFYLIVPRLLKRQANERFALAHFSLVSLGVALIFAPMAYLAVVGPPQRYVDYVESFAFLNTVSTVGYSVAGIGVLLFLAVIYRLMWVRPGA
jgi:cytochrome c oxidase subunit 1